MNPTADKRPQRISPRAARAQARRIGFSLFAVMMLIVSIALWLAIGFERTENDREVHRMMRDIQTATRDTSRMDGQ